MIAALRTGEVPGATGRVGGDDGGLVVIIDVAAFFALLTVGHHRTPFSYDDAARNFYGQRTTSGKSFVPTD
ncbi:MAG: hypothetical protein JOZ19_08515 [Rubrobacter sp.]|nr:hypothetical protein [Rubrobacter sp.]